MYYLSMKETNKGNKMTEIKKPTMFDTKNMPKRRAIYSEIMELEGSKRPFQRIVDNYNIAKRFTPNAYAKGTANWDIASNARATIRAIDKQIEPLVKKMKNTLE